MQQMAAHVHRERCEASEYFDVPGKHADFFVRLTQCRLFYGLANVEASARQGDLSRVVTQRRTAHGQRHVPDVIKRVNQDEGCRRAQRIDVDTGIRSKTWAWRHPQLRFDSGQWRSEPPAQSLWQEETIVHPSIFSDASCGCARAGTVSLRPDVITVMSTLTTRASYPQTVCTGHWR